MICPDCGKKSLNQIGKSDRFVCLECGVNYKLAKQAQSGTFLKGLTKLAKTIESELGKKGPN